MWDRFRRPPRVTRGRWLRDLAIGLWITPPILLFPFTLAAFSDPRVIFDSPDLFLMFFALPFAAGGVLYWISRRPYFSEPLDG